VNDGTHSIALLQLGNSMKIFGSIVPSVIMVSDRSANELKCQ
jgi:hypothetical protein